MFRSEHIKIDTSKELGFIQHILVRHKWKGSVSQPAETGSKLNWFHICMGKGMLPAHVALIS